MRTLKKFGVQAVVLCLVMTTSGCTAMKEVVKSVSGAIISAQTTPPAAPSVTTPSASSPPPASKGTVSNIANTLLKLFGRQQ